MVKRLDFQVDIPTVEQLTDALESAHVNLMPDWGRMSATEMLHHVADFGDLYFGEIKVNLFTRFAAGLLGLFFLRTLITKSPLGGTPRNLRTIPEIKASKCEARDWELGLKRVGSMFNRLEAMNTKIQNHPLYGRMYTSDFKALVLHHTAHHFHQFALI